MNEHTMTINPNSWGFATDGICDGIADVSVIIATGIFLLKALNRDNYVYSKLESGLVKEDGKKSNLWSTFKDLKMQWFMPIVLKTFIFACTFGICSGLWNYFMYNYHILFDTDLIAQTQHQQTLQLGTIHKPRG